METASVLEDEKLTHELYDEIKARTMFEMIEQIDGGKQSLLFLTNKQAELIASQENVAKLFIALGVDGHVHSKPKLLIVLQWDGRFRAHIQAAGPGNTSYNAHERTNGPFLNGDDARTAESRLDQFMLDVLIPLAVRTNAIVICDAVKVQCTPHVTTTTPTTFSHHTSQEFELSASFLRMVAVQRASFNGGILPFSILAFTDEIHCFYANADPKCHWRTVRRQSRAWAKRDQELHALNCTPKVMLNYHRYDLSADAPLVIITDGIDTKQGKAQVRGPATRLLTALTQHLIAKMGLPSIAFRTGYGAAHRLMDDSAVSMLRALDLLNSKFSVIFLDVRDREVCTSYNRQGMIDKAKADYTKLCDELVEKGTLDVLTVCALARFHEVLFGCQQADNQADSTVDAGSPTAIHEALRLRGLREQQGVAEAPQSASEQRFGAATHEQVLGVARFLSQRFHDDSWKQQQGLLHSQGKSEDEIMKAKEEWGNRQQAATQIYMMLLKHKSFHGANVADLGGMNRLVQALVKHDQHLPKENSIEALKLLQMAWAHHDVCRSQPPYLARLCSCACC